MSADDKGGGGAGGGGGKKRVVPKSTLIGMPARRGPRQPITVKSQPGTPAVQPGKAANPATDKGAEKEAEARIAAAGHPAIIGSVGKPEGDDAKAVAKKTGLAGFFSTARERAEAKLAGGRAIKIGGLKASKTPDTKEAASKPAASEKPPVEAPPRQRPGPRDGRLGGGQRAA